MSAKVLDAVVPEPFEAGPAPGQWRKERVVSRRCDCLFATILVPVSGEQSGWRTLDQAVAIARREGGRLYGLHVVPSEAQRTGEEVQAPRRASAQAVQAEFQRRCEAAGVLGSLVIEVGKVARTIADRSRWTDLVVVNLAHPPGSMPVARLGSGFRNLLLWTPRPVLALPGRFSPLSSALLAYDGSPKAREALFVAAYLAGSWDIPLLVVRVTEEDRNQRGALAEAREYLDTHGVQASYLSKRGPVATTILETAREHGSDLILMGGYGHTPIVEAVLGSAVDEVLRAGRMPVLICR